MKKIIFLGLIISLTIASSCKPENKLPQGAWKLVKVEHYKGDIIDSQFPRDYTGSDIIIFSERHLLSVGLFKKDTAIINNYVGATYTLEGNHFEEILLYSPNPEMVGKKVRQILELRNDTLTKTYPNDVNWKLIKSDYTIEKFVRLK
jgi:hypothetical protein